MSNYNKFNCRNNIYNSWSLIPYPGQEKVYHGIEPNAGSWPLVYFKRNEKGDFLDPQGNKVAFEIANPAYFNYKLQLADVIKVSEELTPTQIAMAKYWGTGVPAAQLGSIVLTLISTYKLSPAMSARLLSVIGGVQNDAFIIGWFYKYIWDYPRPVQIDQCFKTIIPTPEFPAYPSGHSVVSGATSVVLSYYFPTEAEKLTLIAEQASISRVYAGVHFRCDCTEGLRLGRQIGRIIVEYLKTQEDDEYTRVDIPKTNYLDAPIMPVY